MYKCLCQHDATGGNGGKLAIQLLHLIHCEQVRHASLYHRRRRGWRGRGEQHHRLLSRRGEGKGRGEGERGRGEGKGRVKGEGERGSGEGRVLHIPRAVDHTYFYDLELCTRQD